MGNNAFLKYYICCSQNMVCVPVVAHGPIVVGRLLYWDVKSKSSKNFIKYLICVKKNGLGWDLGLTIFYF